MTKSIPSQKKQPDKQGMIDVSQKEATQRLAQATCEIRMNPQAFKALVEKASPKGDVLEVAKIAGIMAAKSTPQIIPLCHPLALNKANVTFELNSRRSSVEVTSEIQCLGRTGVEMEAMVAVCVAALTIYDMLKWADPAMVVSEAKLLLKTGGKSGTYRRNA